MARLDSQRHVALSMLTWELGAAAHRLEQTKSADILTAEESTRVEETAAWLRSVQARLQKELDGDG